MIDAGCHSERMNWQDKPASFLCDELLINNMTAATHLWKTERIYSKNFFSFCRLGDEN